MFALAEEANAVLTNSSMLTHVAAAFRRPTVAVIGGSVTKPDVHDATWGYPPPYPSVSPEQYVPGQHAQKLAERRAGRSSVLQSVGTQRTRLGAAA
jgi:ADP-heptose:LPS heptosyltransferase